MVDGIKVITSDNLLLKFADVITLSIPVKVENSNYYSSKKEVQSVVEWTTVNHMQLNF